MGPAREPVWPQAVTGSIAHSEDLAVAVVAATTDILSLGVDIEVADAVRRELWPACLTPRERAGLERSDADRTDLEAALLFSAKESVFKALFQTTRRWIDFPEVEVTLDWRQLRFHVTPLGGLPEYVPGRQDLVGGFRTASGYALTVRPPAMRRQSPPEST